MTWEDRAFLLSGVQALGVGLLALVTGGFHEFLHSLRALLTPCGSVRTWLPLLLTRRTESDDPSGVRSTERSTPEAESPGPFEWMLILFIVAIAVIGVYALFDGDVRRVFATSAMAR